MPVQFDSHGPIFVFNKSLGPAGYVNGTTYCGPVAGIETEFDLRSPGYTFEVSVLTRDYFLFTGDGDDSINANFWSASHPDEARMGFLHTDIIDAGGGSNFVTAGPDRDVIYVDGRNPTHNLWSTADRFASGDNATVWGVTPHDFRLDWLDGQGATGHTGLTAVFSAPGCAVIGLTLSGYTPADLTNGRLSVAFGRTQDIPGCPGADYMTITSMG